MAVASFASSVVACATAPAADPTRRVVAMLLPFVIRGITNYLAGTSEAYAALETSRDELGDQRPGLGEARDCQKDLMEADYGDDRRRQRDIERNRHGAQ